MMKFKYLILLLFSFSSTQAQQRYTNPNTIVDTFKKSIPCIAKGKIGTANTEIKYYSPAVKNRIIWGGLVPYDNVWVTGAHSATCLSSDKDFTIGGKKIAAGKYALFTIPGKEEWIVILNKNYQQHLTDDYNSKDDLIRITVKPIVTETSLERLQYFIENNKIVIAWEKIKIELPFTTN